MSDAPAPEPFTDDATDDARDAAVSAAPEDIVADEPAGRPPVDLDAIERDLSGVETALARLSDGTYYTDEVTGDALPDTLLAADPTVRRA